jgi:hypothetical protein
MDVNALIGAVSAVGFPIVCCIMMGWFISKSNAQQREDIKELNAQHKQEMLSFKEALDNNTNAIMLLTERLKKGE